MDADSIVQKLADPSIVMLSDLPEAQRRRVFWNETPNRNHGKTVNIDRSDFISGGELESEGGDAA